MRKVKIWVGEDCMQNIITCFHALLTSAAMLGWLCQEFQLGTALCCCLLPVLFLLLVLEE